MIASQTQPRELQAVILAAGYGRRMSPLSDSCHKALLPIGGTTILGRIMTGLETIGVERVTVVTGYRADDVESFLGREFPRMNVHLVHNERYDQTNNVVSLSMAFAEMEFDADVVLIECDLLFDPMLLARLAESPGRNVALVDHYRAGMDGTVVTVHDGYVSAIYPPDTQNADFSYADKFKTLNIYRFDREFCRKTLKPLLYAYSTHIDADCYYELVLQMLSNVPAHRISAEVVGGERWVEVDDPNDLAVASFRFEPERRSAILDKAFGGHWNFDVLDFSFIRNSYFPTGSMLAAMRHALPELLSNYGSAQPILNTKLGYVLGCDPRRVQVLHGAAQAFPILGGMLSGRRTAIPSPTFGEYTRIFPDATRYEDAPGIEWDALADTAGDHELCVIVNPNTPTGTTLPSRRIHELAGATPETLFWVDESFLAFSDEPSLIDLLEVEPLDNVVVLTSLSKCLGVPGVRLGHMYSTGVELVAKVGEQLPVWNLSAMSEFLLELLLKFRTPYAESLAQTARDREELRSELAALPFVTDVNPSGADFVLVTFNGAGERAAEIRERLLIDHDIEVKNVTDRFPDRAPRLRIAVRLPEENAILLTALEAVGAGAGAPDRSLEAGRSA